MRSALLLAVALAGCNLTYDREGVKFEPPPSAEGCAAQGLSYCLMGTRAVCTDLAADALNCGACGNVCGVGIDCFSGACGAGTAVCGLIAGEDVCGTPEYPVCVDTTSDAKNCGACHVDCGTQGCVSSACDVSCGATAPNKCLVAGAWTCVDFQNDPANCGACNTPTCTACVSGGCVTGTALTVAPLLPTNGKNWNDWVVGSDHTNAIDTPCDPAAPGRCTHAGELRVVKVASRTSCAGLSATDVLGAFEWTCIIGPDLKAWMVSSKLREATATSPEARLADLVDAGPLTWKPNSVSVSDGTTLIGTTPLTAWWSNPIQVAPTDGVLAGAGVVYIANTSRSSLTLTANRVSLTILPGIVVGPASEIPGAAISAVATLPVGARDFLWIEGKVDATHAGAGVLLNGVRRSTVRAVEVSRDVPAIVPGKMGIHLLQSSGNRLRGIVSVGSLDGVRLEGSSNNDLQNVEVSACGAGVTLFAGSSGNRVRGASIAVNRGEGLVVASANDNDLDQVISSNNDGAGIVLQNATGTRLTNSVAVANALGGVRLEGTTNARVVGLTTVGNRQQGLLLSGGSSSNVLMGVAAHDDDVGLVFTDSSNNTIVDLAVSSALPTSPDLKSDALSSNVFRETLLVGGFVAGASCMTGGTAAGFDAACQPTGASIFTRETTPAWTASFLPASAIGSDAVNGSFTGGTVLVTDLDAKFDWTGFENRYRAWGPVTPGALLGCSDRASRSQAACTLGVWYGDAAVHDWSLVATDTSLLGRLLPPTPVTDSVSHNWSGATTSSVFLSHAVELADAAGGNDDLLCESGETCLLTSNYGAYQGHGSIVSWGAIAGAPLVDPVSLFCFEVNGY